MAKNLIVVKSNNLVEASYKLTLDEMRILLLTIGKIDPSVENHHRDFEFTVAEFVENFGVDEKIAYQQVQAAVDKLGGRWAVLEDTPKVRRKAIFLTDQTYFKGEGRFQIVLHEKLMPFVSEIKNKFTKYNLEYVAKFSGFHSIRLYEILAQYRLRGWREVSLVELKEWLQISDKYNRYNNFNQRVLNPAINEINEKSDLFVEVEPIKRGRSIVSLKFTIQTKKNVIKTEQKRPPFPHKNKYGKFVKLDKQNPAMSSAEYGNYAKDCLAILENFYSELATVTLEDLRNYCVFLETNASNRSKLGTKKDFLEELKKRGYKLVYCELVKLEN
ncbi:replication initiation protein [Gallibacterium anatis]|uniref:replication initiation protein n=2 Tax=Gallibacterium anatis TaxID=750 RepID=UPI0030041EA4